MAIERRRRDGSNGTSVVATACPFCDQALAKQDSLAVHIHEDCPAV